MSEPGQRHILVVDDDERVRTLLSWQLEAEGFTVRCTADGADALDRIDRERPDLVILDLSLPGVAGLDVLRRVRLGEEPAGASPLPVIILSAAAGKPTGSSGWTSAPTTTWSSRSPRESSRRGSGRCCAGPARRARPRPLRA